MQIDAQRDDSGAFLSAMLLKPKTLAEAGALPAAALPLPPPAADAETDADAAAAAKPKAPSSKELQALRKKLETVERDGAADADNAEVVAEPEEQAQSTR